MAVHRFDLPVAVRLHLQSRSGKIDVIAEPRDDVLAEGDDIETMEDADGRVLRVRNGSGGKPFSVRCPVGTDVSAGTQSAAVRLQGEFGDVSVTTMSGVIELEAADEADLRTISASITVGRCKGRCRLNTVSGRVRAGRLGAAAVGTMSGAIDIERVDGPFKAKSVSGGVEAACGGNGAIAVKTVSGKVHITIPDGCEPQTRFKTLSGAIRCDCRQGDDLLIEAMTVSGSIEVDPA